MLKKVLVLMLAFALVFGFSTFAVAEGEEAAHTNPALNDTIYPGTDWNASVSPVFEEGGVNVEGAGDVVAENNKNVESEEGDEHWDNKFETPGQG